VETVTIYFDDIVGEPSAVDLEWINGKKFKDYLRHPSLEQYHFVHKLTTKARAYKEGRIRLKLNDPLKAGENIIIED
jgi:hypothetical protein